MRAKNTCVARLPAVAALLPCFLLLAVLIALLTFASCNNQPRASLLASDLSNLGFIPGKPVNMPSGFKAQGAKHHHFTSAGYTFANGVYSIDEQNRLKSVSLYSSDKFDYEPPSYYTEKQKEDYAKMMEDIKKRRNEMTIVGPSIPEDQRTMMKFITWRGQDIFTLTEKDIKDTYGPPSEPTSPFKEGSGDSAILVERAKMMHYVFQTGPNSEADVTFSFKEKGTAKDTVRDVGLDWSDNLSAEAIGRTKHYPWPGLYPAPGK
jgi:hypothetical protein